MSCYLCFELLHDGCWYLYLFLPFFLFLYVVLYMHMQFSPCWACSTIDSSHWSISAPPSMPPSDITICTRVHVTDSSTLKAARRNKQAHLLNKIAFVPVGHIAWAGLGSSPRSQMHLHSEHQMRSGLGTAWSAIPALMPHLSPLIPCPSWRQGSTGLTTGMKLGRRACHRGRHPSSAPNSQSHV